MVTQSRLHAFLSAFLVLTLLAFSAPVDAARSKPKKLTSAYSSIVIDAATGKVLQESNADAQKYPASLTKMMTLYMLFEAIDSGKLKLGTSLHISAHAASQAPTKLGLEAGERITVREVILGLITKSANDAAAVAAEAMGNGSEERFAEMMTQRARRLGMSNTTFRNASGLPDPGQITTARDLARLSRALIRDFPHHYGYFSTPEFTYAGRTHANHNRLMNWYEGADGIKTGFIRASGFNLAASAVRDNKRLIGVVLGGPSPVARDKYMGQLLDAAFGRTTDYPEQRQAAAPKNGKTAKTEVAAAAPSKSRPSRVVAPAAAAELTVASAPDIQPAARANGAGGETGWAIQVGAFNRIDAARRAAEAAVRLAPDVLGDSGIDISTLDRKKKPDVHRARLTGLSEAQARDACRALQRKHRDCLMLSPIDLRSSVRLATN